MRKPFAKRAGLWGIVGPTNRDGSSNGICIAMVVFVTNIRRTILCAVTMLLLMNCSAKAQSCFANFSNLSFGTVDVLTGANYDSAGTLSTGCSGISGGQRVLLCFALDNGTYPPSGSNRQMGTGANRLQFQIYQDAPRTLVWDSSAGGTVGVSLRRNSPNATVTTYGRVFGGQQIVPPGSYSTTITATISGTIYSGNTPPPCAGQPVLALRTFAVDATVVPSCLATATNMNFGSTSFFTSNLDATSTVTVTCSNTTAYNVRLNGGTTGAISPSARKMSLGVNQVTYGLYRNAARTLGWGQTDGVDTVSGTGTASPTNHTVYGRIPPQAAVPVGTYIDTVIMTVSF